MKKGFTLIELIVVVTILSMLGTIAFKALKGIERLPYEVENKECILENITEIKADLKDCSYIMSSYDCKQETYKKYGCIEIVNPDSGYDDYD